MHSPLQLKYFMPMTMSMLWITSLGKCTIKIFRGGEGVVDGEGVVVKDA